MHGGMIVTSRALPLIIPISQPVLDISCEMQLFCLAHRKDFSIFRHCTLVAIDSSLFDDKRMTKAAGLFEHEGLPFGRQLFYGR